MTNDFDPFDPEVIADPYPWYAKLRERGVHHVEAHDLWVLSRHADVWRGARDNERLISGEGVAYQRVGLPMILTMDQPDHTRIRRIVAREFTPRSAARWRPMVDELAARLVDDAVAAGTVDWVDAVAVPLPVMVIASIIGVPTDDHHRFREWSDAIVEGFALTTDVEPDASAMARTMAGVVGLRAYFDQLDASIAPPGSLLATLRSGVADERLDAEQLFWFFFLLLVAGNETTTNLLGNCMGALLEVPEARATLLREPSRVSDAIEETLRYDAPIQGFFRTAAEDVDFDGTTIPKGSRVLLSFGAANRDERAFPDADRFVLDRPARDHVAFGSGIHHCLGAHLARMEGVAVFRALAERVREISPVGDGVRTSNPNLRGYRSLPVELMR